MWWTGRVFGRCLGSEVGPSWMRLTLLQKTPGKSLKPPSTLGEGTMRSLHPRRGPLPHPHWHLDFEVLAPRPVRRKFLFVTRCRSTVSQQLAETNKTFVLQLMDCWFFQNKTTGKEPIWCFTKISTSFSQLLRFSSSSETTPTFKTTSILESRELNLITHYAPALLSELVRVNIKSFIEEHE